MAQLLWTAKRKLGGRRCRALRPRRPAANERLRLNYNLALHVVVAHSAHDGALKGISSSLHSRELNLHRLILRQLEFRLGDARIKLQSQVQLSCLLLQRPD